MDQGWSEWGFKGDLDPVDQGFRRCGISFLDFVTSKNVS